MTTGEWISTKDRLPECGKINGFWDEVPVIVKKKGNPRPFGAGFTYHGGDDVYPDDHPLPKFSVDCGMGIPDITHWMEMPEPPKDPLVDRIHKNLDEIEDEFRRARRIDPEVLHRPFDY